MEKTKETGKGTRLDDRQFEALREILRRDPCAEARRLMGMARQDVLREVDERVRASRRAA